MGINGIIIHGLNHQFIQYMDLQIIVFSQPGHLVVSDLPLYGTEANGMKLIFIIPFPIMILYGLYMEFGAHHQITFGRLGTKEQLFIGMEVNGKKFKVRRILFFMIFGEFQQIMCMLFI